jgi:hypothetical protein
MFDTLQSGSLACALLTSRARALTDESSVGAWVGPNVTSLFLASLPTDCVLLARKELSVRASGFAPPPAGAPQLLQESGAWRCAMRAHSSEVARSSLLGTCDAAKEDHCRCAGCRRGTPDRAGRSWEPGSLWAAETGATSPSRSPESVGPSPAAAGTTSVAQGARAAGGPAGATPRAGAPPPRQTLPPRPPRPPILRSGHLRPDSRDGELRERTRRHDGDDCLTADCRSAPRRNSPCLRPSRTGSSRAWRYTVPVCKGGGGDRGNGVLGVCRCSSGCAAGARDMARSHILMGGIGVYNTQKLSNPSNSRESNNEERD